MLKQEFDYLIIGSGMAGLFAAIRASQYGSVALVSKRQLDECNSKYAQGGICCVLGQVEDSFEEHAQDTFNAGAGLCNEDAVRQIVTQAPERIKDLIDMGVHFTTRGEVEDNLEPQEENDFDLGKEGGHQRRRILHAGDITGAEIIRALVDKCRQQKNISIFEDHHAHELISNSKFKDTDEEDQILGAYVLDVENNLVRTLLAKVTILATGGAGKVYQYTTNPDIATGDGMAMAYRAGAEISNMEFFQFHPTCLYHHNVKSFLISEAIRGEGAVLKIRKKGKYVEFMNSYHEMGSLAPRDIVARAIDKELKETGEKAVFLDITHHSEEYLKKRFPTIFETCDKNDINISRDLIPVVPAAHYCCGGVKTNTDGVSSIKRLYAIGETANTGLHGANRLASNSLMEAVVMAHNAISNATNKLIPNIDQKVIAEQYQNVPVWNTGNATDSDEMVVITHNWQEIRTFMWDYVGIFRTTNRLQRAKRRIRNIQDEIQHYYWDFVITSDLIELRNLASVAEMIIDSALLRKESRGLHYNFDYPELLKNPSNTIIKKS